MIVRVGIVAVVSACTYAPPNHVIDDARPIDTGVDVDVPIDMPMSQRVQLGLIGFWTFNDAAGSTNAADTSGNPVPVKLKVETSAIVSPPTFAGGRVTATTPARLISDPGSHLAGDCMTNGGVTLEVWLRAGVATQGTITEPKYVAGLAKSILLRDVVLLHAGDKWLGRVRTGPAQDGKPNLVSTSTVQNTAMTHVVLVADATQRKLYVDNVAEADDPAPSPPTSWDTTYSMALFDEPAGGRQWLGEIAMVALYDRALAPSEVQQNFDQGPDAP